VELSNSPKSTTNENSSVICLQQRRKQPWLEEQQLLWYGWVARQCVCSIIIMDDYLGYSLTSGSFLRKDIAGNTITGSNTWEEPLEGRMWKPRRHFPNPFSSEEEDIDVLGRLWRESNRVLLRSLGLCCGSQPRCWDDLLVGAPLQRTYYRAPRGRAPGDPPARRTWDGCRTWDEGLSSSTWAIVGYK